MTTALRSTCRPTRTDSLWSFQSQCDKSNHKWLLAITFEPPGIFAPLTILIQVVFGFGLLLGYKTKVCAYVLAGYALFFALVMKLQEPQGLIFVLQYLAIAGGLLMVAVHHQMPCSLDNLKKK